MPVTANAATDPGKKPSPPMGLLSAVLAAVLLSVAVSAASLALSYDAIEAVGRAAHMDPRRVWMLPVSVDGTMTVSALAAALLGLLTGRTPWYPMAVFALGAVISAWCNGMHAVNVDHLAAGWRIAVSVIPAVMSVVAPHLVLHIGKEIWQALAGRQDEAVHATATVGAPLPVPTPPAPAPEPVLENREAVPQLPPAPAPTPTPVPAPPAAQEPPPPPDRVPEPAGRRRLELVPPAGEQPGAGPLPEPEHPPAGNARLAARQLFRQGKTVPEIAAQLGKSRRQVERYTQDLRDAQDRAQAGA